MAQTILICDDDPVQRRLLEAVPGVTAVRDATDHDGGTAPYAPRNVAR